MSDVNLEGSPAVAIERAQADLSRARADVARLESQLRIASERVVKLENYLEMARLYEAADEAPGGRRNGGSTLLQAAIEIIRERGARQRTAVLVEELERKGHHIGGTNKVTNLSGTLSRSQDLVASRTEGWGLKEWDREEDPQMPHEEELISEEPDLEDAEVPF